MFRLFLFASITALFVTTISANARAEEEDPTEPWSSSYNNPFKEEKDEYHHIFKDHTHKDDKEKQIYTRGPELSNPVPGEQKKYKSFSDIQRDQLKQR